MGRYKRFAYLIFIIEIILLLSCNGLYLYQNKSNFGRMYRVEAGRVAIELQENAPEEIDLAEYDTILAVSEFDSEEVCNNDYVVEKVGGKLYRIEYRMNQNFNMLIYICLLYTSDAADD